MSASNDDPPLPRPAGELDRDLETVSLDPSLPRRRHVLPGELFAGRFEVERLVSRDDLSSVYRARDRKIGGREVALQLFDSPAAAHPRFRELFAQEVRAAQNFVSVYAVPVRETGAAPSGALFLTMDAVRGESLADLLARDGKLSARHALEIARQMLIGLQSAHDQGFVHGEVTPSNTLLASGAPRTEENPFGVRVRLVGFGLARLARDAARPAAALPVSRHGAPEAARGEPIDERADLWSVGACLFECLTGRPLFGGEGEELARRVGAGGARPLVARAELPRSIRRLLARALRDDPDRRFRSAGDFAAAIERCPEHRGARGTPAWARAALVLALAAAGAEAALLWRAGAVRAGEDAAPSETETEAAAARIDAAVEEERARLVARHRADLEERDARLAELRDELAAREAALEHARSASPERGPERGPETEPGTEPDAELAELRAAHEELAASLEEARSRVSELEGENRRLASAAAPPSLEAETFDGVLARVRQRAGGQALRFLEARRAEGKAFADPAAAGAGLVLAVARAAAEIEEASDARSRGGSDTAALARAREHLADARARSSDLPAEARGWLTDPDGSGSEPDRLGALGDVLERLEGQIAEVQAAADERRERLRAEVAAAPPGAPPGRALDYFAEFEPAGLAAHLERIAVPLAEELSEGGRLDVGRLRSSAAVRGWGEHLFGPGTDVAGEGAETLRRLALARAWYAGEALPAGAAEHLPVPVELPERPAADWEARLALQVALAGEAPAFPPRPGTRTVHDHRTPSARYLFLDVASDADAGDADAAARIERRVFDADGSPVGAPQHYTLARDGALLLVGGQPIVDLRDAGEHVRVAAWSRAPLDSLPSREWARGFATREFAAELARRPAPCLVVESEDAELWISPGFGIVRELRPGRFTRRLAFTSATPSSR